MNFLLTVKIILIAALASACSFSTTRPGGGEGSQATSTNGYTDSDTLSDFTGQASPAELAVLLNNSDLTCSAGQTLLFDGTNWNCGSLARYSLEADETACDSSKVGEMRRNSTYLGMDICQDFLGTGNYMWVASNGHIREDITITIDGGNAAFLNQVIIDIQQYKFRHGSSATINLEDGTYNLSSIVIKSHHMKELNIIGNTTTPSNVNLVFDARTGFRITDGTLGFLDGVRITGTGDSTGRSAIRLEKSSNITLGANVEIYDWDETAYGILAIDNSYVDSTGWTALNHLVMSNVTNGVYVTGSSAAKLDYIEITGRYPTVSTGDGISAYHSSHVRANFADVSNFQQCIIANRTSTVDVNDAVTDKCETNVRSNFTSSVLAVDTTHTNCDNECIQSQRGSFVEASNVNVTCTAGGTHGFFAEHGAQIMANGTSSTTCTDDYDPNINTHVNNNMIWP